MKVSPELQRSLRESRRAAMLKSLLTPAELEAVNNTPGGPRVPPAYDAAYDDACADERARIVWWLRAGVDGPAAVNTDPRVVGILTELADVIAEHPERFAQAPTGRTT